MKKEKFIFLIILFLFSMFSSFIIGLFLKWNIFRITSSYGFQLLMFTILTCSIYFCNKYLKFLDSVITSIIISLLFTLFLKNTPWSAQFGGTFNLLIYLLLLFSSFAVIFRLSWYNNKHHYLRSISFSVLAAFIYIVINYSAIKLLHLYVTAGYILDRFVNILLIMLIVSFEITAAEIIYNNLNKFFSPPEKIIHTADKEEEEDK